MKNIPVSFFFLPQIVKLINFSFDSRNFSEFFRANYENPEGSSVHFVLQEIDVYVLNWATIEVADHLKKERKIYLILKHVDLRALTFFVVGVDKFTIIGLDNI